MLADPRRQKQLQQLILKLGLSAESPVNWALLDRALTDPTASPTANYERLEFVGDAVVKLTAGEFLYQQYPDVSEGELSAIRSILVSDRLLAQIAQAYGIDRYLILSSSALADHAGQETRLAAALEAMLAALYLSTHDLRLIHPWLDGHLLSLAEEIRRDPALQNYKGALQNLTQNQHQILPEYRVTELNPTSGSSDRFAAEVWVNGQCWGRGKGQSKKTAEQAAAQEAFLALSRSSY
ncbi:ribonuclease III [Leptolyngbya ohadii]|uniref:ribonuclease III n=1 Tax=Leptolyngbya ohadii TaxID=1962290 RepID=UPI000B59F6AB|nr:ribonuclease III [Leptolyngbya ohadii]